ncbi:MAG: DUF1122 family protein [Ignisphaera sp.]
MSMQIPCIDVFRSLRGFGFKALEKRGRFPEEKAIELYIGCGSSWQRLMVLKIFDGRPPFYRKWVEVFSINPVADFGSAKYVFVNSAEEKMLIDCLSRYINPGERLFIEYVYDRETWKALEIGVPPHLTRLGFMLLENGFTWFKDWYYPEGFMEGNPKIQVEKPLDDDMRRRHIVDLCKDARDFEVKAKMFIQQKIYVDIFEGVLNRIQTMLTGMCKGVA